MLSGVRARGGVPTGPPPLIGIINFISVGQIGDFLSPSSREGNDGDEGGGGGGGRSVGKCPLGGARPGTYIKGALGGLVDTLFPFRRKCHVDKG